MAGDIAARVTSDLSALYVGDDAARDAAVKRAAADAGRHAADYAPKPFVFARAELVRPWFNLDVDALRVAACANAELFGAYRNAVLSYEADCARRLLAAAWSLRQLYRFRDLPGSDAAKIDSYARPLAVVLIEWGIRDDLFARMNVRGWESAFTRRYDLLPRAWRYV